MCWRFRNLDHWCKHLHNIRHIIHSVVVYRPTLVQCNCTTPTLSLVCWNNGVTNIKFTNEYLFFYIPFWTPSEQFQYFDCIQPLLMPVAWKDWEQYERKVSEHGITVSVQLMGLRGSTDHTRGRSVKYRVHAMYLKGFRRGVCNLIWLEAKSVEVGNYGIESDLRWLMIKRLQSWIYLYIQVGIGYMRKWCKGNETMTEVLATHSE